jgi:hypothetical protein
MIGKGVNEQVVPIYGTTPAFAWGTEEKHEKPQSG